MKPFQVSIAFTTETPAYHAEGYEDFSKQNPWVNWTGTHRSDSDLQWPYGFFYKILKGENVTRELGDKDLVNLT